MSGYSPTTVLSFDEVTLSEAEKTRRKLEEEIAGYTSLLERALQLSTKAANLVGRAGNEAAFNLEVNEKDRPSKETLLNGTWRRNTQKALQPASQALEMQDTILALVSAMRTLTDYVAIPDLAVRRVAALDSLDRMAASLAQVQEGIVNVRVVLKGRCLQLITDMNGVEADCRDLCELLRERSTQHCQDRDHAQQVKASGGSTPYGELIEKGQFVLDAIRERRARLDREAEAATQAKIHEHEMRLGKPRKG